MPEGLTATQVRVPAGGNTYLSRVLTTVTRSLLLASRISVIVIPDRLSTSQVTMDRNYTALLTHLHRPTLDLPLQAVQGALAHYLAHLSPPTPLAAAAVSSQHFTTDHEPLSVTFRHAVHNKRKLIVDSTSLISRGAASRLSTWVTDVMKGLQGGQAIVRLAASGGLLLGIEDMKLSHKLDVGDRSRVEDEIILCLAEVLDLYRYEYEPSSSQWESEFKKDDGDAFIVLYLLYVRADTSSQSRFYLVSFYLLHSIFLSYLLRRLSFCLCVHAQT
jgi:hypothetical protein